MDHANLLDFLTLLPVRYAILPCVMCFATSLPENLATCSNISGSGQESEPIRRFLFIDYIIICVV